ncbi:MAG: glycosyltransferase [Bacteroidota bacterium]
MDLEPGIKLSVSLITYNQKDYIRQAIDGVLKQKTNFRYELIIGDDCSTDGTREILMRYREENPDIIRLILHPERNKGIPGKLNFISTLKAATGKFLALIDGDDYWINNQKLQKQVDFLEQHPDYAVCCHDVFHRKNNKNYRSGHEVPVDSDISYLLRKGNYISTPSVMYRNDSGMAAFMEQFPDASFGDYLMNINAALMGKIKFMKERMAVYRIHSGGVWSKLSFEESFIKTISVIEMLFDYFNDKKYKDDLKIQLLGILDELLWIKEFRGLAEHPSLIRIMTKMGIPDFIPEYLKFNSIERSTSSYFSQNVPVPVLAKALKQRMTNKIFKR